MRRTVRLLVAALAALVLLYAAAVAFMYMRQEAVLYDPSREGRSPAEAGLKDVQVVGLTTPDKLRLEAWYVAAEPGKPTILFFHGKGGEISGRPKRFTHNRARGYGVLFVSYRGFGKSEGRPSEAGFILDAVTAYDWLITTGVAPERICLVGESLGTGVAVQLAALKPVAALALEAPYTSILEIGEERYWWLPVRWLLRDQFRSIEHIGKINAPLLVQHGMDDESVPFPHGERLFAAAKEPKQFIRWPATGHVDLFDEPAWDAELAFFERVLAEAPPAP